MAPWTRTPVSGSGSFVEGVTKIVKSILDNMEQGIEEAKGGGEAAPSTTGTVFVRPGGNDANSGSGWANAKQSFAAAIAALPTSKEGEKNGTVNAGYGTFAVASSRREDSVVLNKTQYVEDASAVAGDVGKYLYNPKLDGTFGASQEYLQITEVWEGELEGGTVKKVKAGTGKKFLTLEDKVNKTETVTMWVVEPAIFLPAGVTLVGRGMFNGKAGHVSTNFPTLLEDTGTGITIMGEGSASGTGTASKTRLQIENISLTGSKTALCGILTQNVFDVRIARVYVANYLQWGINLCANAVSGMELEDVCAYFNGAEKGKIGAVTSLLTGGIRCNESAPVGTANNVMVHKNYGVGMEATGVACTGCQFNGTFKQEISAGVFVNNSGIGLLTAGTGIHPTTAHRCWFEGNQEANALSIRTTFIGCHFQADSGGTSGQSQYAVISGQGGTTLINCRFQKHEVATVKEQTKAPINWMNCEPKTTGSGTNETIFIKRTAMGGGGVRDIPISAAFGTGRVGEENEPARMITGPVPPTKVALTSGTPWQNTTGGDVRLTVPLSWPGEAGVTAEIKMGPISASQGVLGTMEKNATTASKSLETFYVPAQWYFTVTLVKATFTGEATAQPS